MDSLLFDTSGAHLSTALDIREGQKVVVGKTATEQNTLILVISAKILN